MRDDTPHRSKNTQGNGPGTVRLRLDRRLHGGLFTPLAPPVSVDVALDNIGYDLLSRLHLRGEATLSPGEHPIPLLPDLVLPVRVLPGTRAQVDLRAERSGPEGRTRLAGFDMTFTSPLAIENILPVLSRLPGLFEDRGLKALRSRAEGLASLAGIALQGYGDLLERPRNLLGKLRGRIGRPGALVDVFTDLVDRFQGAQDEIATVLLKRISARPVRRPEGWELDLRFSGETNYLDKVLIPFNDVRLPRALIPSFHATLDHLLSRHPAASARVRTDRLRSRDLARAIGGMVDRFQATVDLAGEAPELELEGTTSAAGRFRVRVAAPGAFTLRGKVKGRLGSRSARLSASQVVLASGGTRTLARGEVRVRTRGNRPLIDALLDDRPLDHLDVEVEGHADEGSTLPALRIAARTDHPLLQGETAAVVSLEQPDFSGDAMLRLGTVPAQRLALSIAARFQTEAGTGFDNGANVLEVAALSGEMRGSIRSEAPRTFSIALDGEAGGAARATTRIPTFPELEIEDGLLEALLDGTVRYKTCLNIRPRGHGGTDWEFSGTRLDLHLRQGQARFGDRSLTLPEDTDFYVDVLKGTLGTSGLGRANVGLGWDMHDRSPVLRRGRRATEIWVPELRRNAFNLRVSPSGGLSINGPEGGLYDSRYFNALLNPTGEVGRWLEVLESNDAVDRVLSSVRVLSDEAADLLEVLRDVARRLRTAVDAEGIREPKHLIPAPRMARLLSRLLTDSDADDARVLPLLRQVIAGEGLNVPAVKALLYEHFPDHSFEFEVDRLLRWLSRVLAPMDPEPAFPIREVTPLTEDPAYRERFAGIPTAADLYRDLGGSGALPADLAGRIGRLAPWLNPAQLSYILSRREEDLPQGIRQRLRHILDVKWRVQTIEAGYGGVGFAPQAVAISFFLGDTIAMGIAPAPDTDTAGIPEELVPHSLIGPRDVALLLQSGLAAAWTGRTVQLNQRLLLDMMGRMPPLFLHGVLVEMGENNPRILAGVLLALLDMEQGKVREPVDLVRFFSEKLGVPFPRRSDYMAGGRCARLSYYEALTHTAEQVVNEGATYRALKYRLQEARHRPRRPLTETDRLRVLCDDARRAMAEADTVAGRCTFEGSEPVRRRRAEVAFRGAFDACAALQAEDRRAFTLPFFKAFWARNHEALMVRSVVRNAQQDVDRVRHWIGVRSRDRVPDEDQALVERVIQVLYHAPEDRARLLSDPLVRLLLEPAPGHYNLTVVSCMGVITEGAQGTELEDAYRRLDEQRGVRVIRADTATGRSLEYNAGKAIEAIQCVEGPWAWIGYSQGCPNGMMAEHLLRSGTPDQQRLLRTLRTRNLLFGALNGTPHGTAGDQKFVRAMVDLDHFISHYQTLFSEQAIQLGLRSIRMALDARPVVLGMMGMRSLSRWGILPLSRAGQFRDDVPTASMRGVVEPGTLPETLEFLSNVLTRQIESPLHDTQVTVEDAVGHPRWVKTPQTEALAACDIGCLVQRTHHWSPIRKVVEFVTTERDEELAIFHTPKDRHVFPWLEACARFGVINRK
ncbi:MAG: hypothetical protein ABIK09_08190 [Pseudomonadota bacterium]